MNKLKIILASALMVFSIIDVEAQRRRNNNNNGERVNKTRTVRVIRTRPSVRFGVNNRNIYFNRFNHSYYGGYYGPSYLGHRFVRVNPYGLSHNPEAYKNRMEELRAYMLFKYNLKKSKRNARRLMKYNVLSGRDANEGIN